MWFDISLFHDISFRVTWLALELLYMCLSASEASLVNMSIYQTNDSSRVDNIPATKQITT